MHAVTKVNATRMGAGGTDRDEVARDGVRGVEIVRYWVVEVDVDKRRSEIRGSSRKRGVAKQDSFLTLLVRP
jgi:hypothetical protein